MLVVVSVARRIPHAIEPAVRRIVLFTLFPFHGANVFAHAGKLESKHLACIIFLSFDFANLN